VVVGLFSTRASTMHSIKVLAGAANGSDITIAPRRLLAILANLAAQRLAAKLRPA
jgi:hypothetical protein